MGSKRKKKACEEGVKPRVGEEAMPNAKQGKKTKYLSASEEAISGGYRSKEQRKTAVGMARRQKIPSEWKTKRKKLTPCPDKGPN